MKLSLSATEEVKYQRICRSFVFFFYFYLHFFFRYFISFRFRFYLALYIFYSLALYSVLFSSFVGMVKEKNVKLSETCLETGPRDRND